MASSPERREKLTEIAAAIILSVGAFISSWSGYQAALWDGEQAAYYARAGAARVLASRLHTSAGQFEGADMLMFTEWLDAHAHKDTALEKFYRDRFRPEFVIAFNRWVAMHPATNRAAPPTPFAMPDYRSHVIAQSDALERRADALFEAGQKANDTSDAFVNGTVFLALSLFLCGIAQTFESHRLRFVLLGVAALACAAGILRIFDLPTLSLK